MKTIEELKAIGPNQLQAIAQFELMIETLLKQSTAKAVCLVIYQDSFCDGDPCPEYKMIGLGWLDEWAYLNDKFVHCDDEILEKKEVSNGTNEERQFLRNYLWLLPSLVSNNGKVLVYSLHKKKLVKTFVPSPFRHW